MPSAILLLDRTISSVMKSFPPTIVSGYFHPKYSYKIFCLTSEIIKSLPRIMCVILNSDRNHLICHEEFPTNDCFRVFPSKIFIQNFLPNFGNHQILATDYVRDFEFIIINCAREIQHWPDFFVFHKWMLRLINNSESYPIQNRRIRYIARSFHSSNSLPRFEFSGKHLLPELQIFVISIRSARALPAVYADKVCPLLLRASANIRPTLF